MSIRDKIIKDLSHEETRFQQLHIAHQATLLVYAKSLTTSKEDGGSTRELARKLRPEFSKVFVATQVRECFKLIRKHDADDTLPPIDLIIADFDQNLPKLLDSVNKRPTQKETSHLPLIPIIIVLPEDKDNVDRDIANSSNRGFALNDVSADARAAIEMVGGANHIHENNVTSKEVLVTALGVLGRRKVAELAYRDLKAKKMKIGKYPYMPLFISKSGVAKNTGDDDDDDDELGAFQSSASTQKGPRGVKDSIGSSASLQELDDWTDTSSMHPNFVGKRRVEMKITMEEDHFAATKGDFKERQVVDKNIVRFLQSGKNLQHLAEDAHERQESLKRTGELTTSGGGSVAGGEAEPPLDFDNQSVVSTLSAVHTHEVPIQEFPDDLLPLSKEAEAALAVGKDTPVKAATSSDVDAASSSENATKEVISGSSTSNLVSKSLSKSDLLGEGSSEYKVEKAHNQRSRNAIVPLVKREMPNSLGRLLDPQFRPTWKGLNNYHISDNESQRSNGSDNNLVDMSPFIRKERPSTAVLHSVGGLNKTAAAEQWKLINLSNFESVGNETISAKNQLGDGATSKQNEKIEQFLQDSDEMSQAIETRSAMIMNEFGNDLNNTGTSKTSKRVFVDPAAVTMATKTLKRMARDSAPDVQLNDLIPLSLDAGKVSIGDRDILEAGRKAEEEDRLEVAITMYKRAGLHTNKPHMSRMFLACIHYKMGKFMQALDYLNWAVDSQDKIKHLSVFSKDDQFISLYNRALVNFRLGNDDKGLLDIRAAISMQPSHLKAREVLALALRRVTRYGESIEISKQNALMRKETLLQEEELQRQLLEKQKRRAQLSKERLLKRGIGSSRPSTVSGVRGRDSSMLSAHSKNTDEERHAKHGGVYNSLVSSSVSVISDASDMLPVICPVEDKGGMGSMKSRKLQKLRQLTAHGTEGSNMPGEALKTFKLTNGFHDDLYEELFTKPSELQDALLVSPQNRTEEHLETISCTLKLFPSLWMCNDSTIKGLCRCVEYRALQTRSNLYTQNNRADAVCFLLRGSMQGRLDSMDASSASKMIVCDVGPYDTVGQIDLLFENSRSAAPKDLMKQIEKARLAKLAGLEAEANSALNIPVSDKDTEKDNDDFNNVVEDENNSEDEDEVDLDSIPRCCQNKMFVTYTMTSLCELLVCNQENFEKLLYTHAYDELKSRLDIVEGCRVFSEWNKEELIRLARMGQLQVFRSGDLILKQGVKPNYLSLIIKGMCKSYKSPNKSTVLRGKLAEAEEKAARHDLKYSYHHKLKDVMSKGVLVPPTKSSEIQKSKLSSRTHVTVSEALRYSLGIEIKMLTKELKRAVEAEAKAELEEPSMDDVNESITSQLSEISTLQWPMLYGESCLLDPENGTTRGTIVADTTLHVLSIHKSQLQTFRVRENLMERIKYRGVSYPEDEELLREKEQKELWEVQRQSIVRTLSRSKEEYLEPFYV
jgi:tetratricopeptide (TPR) repeat protein